MLSTITPYRCAECGSRKVIPCSNGKEVTLSHRNIIKRPSITEYKCPECGAQLPYSMNARDKAAVDSMVLVSGEDAGTVARFLKKYKNIEIDPALHLVHLYH